MDERRGSLREKELVGGAFCRFDGEGIFSAYA